MPKRPLSEPFDLFAQWYAEASVVVADPTIMTLATSTKDGKPSARVVLLKHFDARGFCFFTNLLSRKGRELHDNPFAALSIFWPETKHHIRIEGSVEKVSDREADEYFLTRERGSQLGAWASKQSEPMQEMEELVTRVKMVTEEYKNQSVPRPPFWSGFRVVPTRLEFWQEGEYRLHTRLCYTKIAKQTEWKLARLYP